MTKLVLFGLPQRFVGELVLAGGLGLLVAACSLVSSLRAYLREAGELRADDEQEASRG